LKSGKHMKNNTHGVKKLIHKIFKTLKIVFEALEVLKKLLIYFNNCLSLTFCRMSGFFDAL